ncbi:MAG: hypothetical protein OJF49_000384 [Ktedonobacterales bacterium]|nr:MAG: hypothetical protein OJF49_000384 [Ktedonobacterales bacterium]
MLTSCHLIARAIHGEPMYSSHYRTRASPTPACTPQHRAESSRA